jgi:hypothetical protein
MDCLALDRVLGSVPEPVEIIIRVQSDDISQERLGHNRYMLRLESINRLWDREDNPSVPDNYFGEEKIHHYRSRDELVSFRLRDPLANDILRKQQKLHETLSESNLAFNIRVMARSEAVVRMIGSTLANLAFEEECYRLLVSTNSDVLFNTSSKLHSSPEVVLLPIFEHVWPNADTKLVDSLQKLCQLASVDELLGLFRLPIASPYTSPCCIRKNTDPPLIDPKELMVLGHDQDHGFDEDEWKRIPRGIKLPNILKHLFVCGMSGLGKTTAIINILIQLVERGIPFMVLEMSKKNYRVLKTFKEHPDAAIRKLARKIEVYTSGADTASPFRFNPLSIPEGISEDEHIDNIIECFKGTMPISGPMPALLGESLEKLYQKFPTHKRTPTIGDLAEIVEAVLDSKGYSGEVNSNIKTALVVRVEDLTRRTIG